jgi:hypothetical protein
MKLFIALGGELHRFTKKKLQIATPKQDKWLVWLSRKGSHSDTVELKTDLQTKNMVSANAITALRRLWDVDSYASNPASKYLIQEKNRIGRFEFLQKYRHMDIQGLSQSILERQIDIKSAWIRWDSIDKRFRRQKNECAIHFVHLIIWWW